MWRSPGMMCTYRSYLYLLEPYDGSLHRSLFSGSDPKTTPIVMYGPASSGVFVGAGKMLRISKSASVDR